MIPPFDIFKIESGKDVRWLDCANDFEAAQARVQVLGQTDPGEFLIVDLKSDRRFLINIPSNIPSWTARKSA
jgi:hypothetical protein